MRGSTVGLLVYVCFCEGVWELRVSTDALIIINYT